MREDRREWAGEVRAEQTTIDELEAHIRNYPEDRAKTEPDLNSSRRAIPASMTPDIVTSSV